MRTYFFTRIKGRLNFCHSMGKLTFMFFGCEKDVEVDTILLADEGSCVNTVVYGKSLNRRIVKVAECLARKIGKRLFL
ncbi:hypothetical protein K1720_08510 [Thermococcus argininiproducens]|uniref:Uncharacterized protein n=1 Tax=Thermococcus argininiproducens TaxID=2866384 RepID=A0A9E7SC87_9EURY|nr:hypothetical protein [Thermococcus argininiproducens]USG99545.1 hypothetical protein K1720_08510 [Thermococcus argininiproducens]